MKNYSLSDLNWNTCLELTRKAINGEIEGYNVNLQERVDVEFKLEESPLLLVLKIDGEGSVFDIENPEIGEIVEEYGYAMYDDIFEKCIKLDLAEDLFDDDNNGLRFGVTSGFWDFDEREFIETYEAWWFSSEEERSSFIEDELSDCVKVDNLY